MPANIVETKLGADLYLNEQKLFGIKLKEQILKDVKASQLFAGRHLPDKLYITDEQFKSIEDDTTRMDDTTDRYYQTPMNVMEVHMVE